MKVKILKFLILIVCIFCIAFYSVSAKQPQQEQSFNTALQEILINTSDIEISQKFQAAAFKMITFSETIESPRGKNEFHGARTLRELFGDERQKFDVTYIYLNDNTPVVTKANATWYIVNRKNGSVEYKLYYGKNPVTETMQEGDFLFIGKVNNEQLFIIITSKDSLAKDKLLASLKVEIPITKAIQSIKPTNSWYKVYFTPGPDCENNIISRLESAQQIDIAVYTITNRNLVNAVIAAHKRGAKVRVITDQAQSEGEYSRVRELIEAGVPVRTNVYVTEQHRIEHNKFAIFDEKEMKLGSYNWTSSATKANSESCMFFKQEGKEFSKRYEELWGMYN
ncbi:hypothetical protein tpqmel_0712 [Candidatus Gastranaerophilus sp. (ex Termes propinquus)]|nr:hypothetical protein tpqmel_0712 [Candidatus Gastranaerophilus sp. (ex Termes propinquus)]